MDQLNPFHLFDIHADEFEEAALKVFRFQYQNNGLYKNFVDLVKPRGGIQTLTQIPFLPISFFKTHVVKTGQFNEEATFESSGTSGMTSSKHAVKDLELYKNVSFTAFERLYGSLEDYCILALLPSYLEKGNSSLVFMVQEFMKRSKHAASAFYLSDFDALHETLKELEEKGQKTLLIGVTYALLDFATAFPLPLKHTIVMETGGMKGRKRELIRSEVHQTLSRAFGSKDIHSEYGMTELLLQAYSQRDGMFTTPPWMRVLISDQDDPFLLHKQVQKPTTGRLHVIDLANIHSCSFIATEDVARLHPNGSFEVLGREDNTDMRGCSLLAL